MSIAPPVATTTGRILFDIAIPPTIKTAATPPAIAPAPAGYHGSPADRICRAQFNEIESTNSGESARHTGTTTVTANASPQCTASAALDLESLFSNST